MVFSHPSSKRILRGLRNLYPSIRPPLPAWDLPLVLQQLMRRPFEPMATYDIRLLSWKTAFLMAITSARRVSELAALRSISPYLAFLPHSVRLRLDIRFLPKVVSDFHTSLDIILPDIFPSLALDEERHLHALDVKGHSCSTLTEPSLFVCYLDSAKFVRLLFQALSRSADLATTTLSLDKSCY